MHRLVKFPSLKIPIYRNITHPCSTKVCPLCGINNPNLKSDNLMSNSIHAKLHSTSTGLNPTIDLIKKIKSRKSDKKFFAELLEVFDHNSAHTKASVRKLKPGDVSLLATSPNIQLDHFHEVRKKHKNRNNKLRVLLEKTEYGQTCGSTPTDTTSTGAMVEKINSSTHLPNKMNDSMRKSSIESSETLRTDDFNESDIFKEEIERKSSKPISEQDMNDISISLADTCFNDPTVQESIVEAYDPHGEDIDHENDQIVINQAVVDVEPKPMQVNNRKVALKRPTKDVLIKQQMSEVEKLCRQKAFNTTLLTYISICVSCDLLQRGMASLMHHIYRSKMSPKNPKITDVGIFEVLMNGFAMKANQSRVDELWRTLISINIKPSINVFTSRLECAARSKNTCNLIPDILQSLHEEGFQLNDIFIKSKFLRDQRELILKAIQEVIPTFQPVVPPPPICYSCSLLQEINEHHGENFNLKSPAKGILNKKQLQKFSEEQFENEFSFYLKIKSIEKRIEPEGLLQFNRMKLEIMRNSWLEDLKKGFSREIAILKLDKKPSGISLLPFMQVLDSQQYIDIMLKEVQKLAEGSETFSPTTLQLYKNLGNQVRNRYVIKFKKTNGIISKTKMLYDKYCDWYLNPSVNNCRSSNGRQEWQQLLHDYHQSGPSITGDEEFWPPTVITGIGKFLYNIIIGDVKIDVNILHRSCKQAKLLPAFYRVYRPQGVKNMEEIKPHPVISKLYRAAGEEHLHFDITLVPMVSPPLPWTSYQSGGYLMSKTDIIRLPDQALHQRQRLREAPRQQLYPPLDSLNQLGSVPWRINNPVLDTIIEVFNNGGNTKLDIPEPPHSSPVPEPAWPGMTKEQRYEAYRHRLILRRQKAEMYSLWCDALYKLSLANHFRDRVFWLPHNMDFRGRVYPCPPHLSHLGGDMSRSLLHFAQGQLLGPSGLDWLKIHLVNLLGTKKRDAVADRLTYANTIMPEILDSAQNPLKGQKWWMESESPWQTLACCMEIHAACHHPGGPENFVSHFPIHQDGSCNGLQHYAALGRDESGAASVNLMPQPIPQDVYSCVAALVERERAKDSAAGILVAKELDGFVRRKVIKQTVMTTVYGVTRFGARLQIAKQLKDIDSFPKELVWPASTYLAAKTFESLREMFKSTREIQDWFTECARQVSQLCGQNMEYVTPLGLPVVQHYVRTAKRKQLFETNKFGHIYQFFPIDIFERPNVMKQKNAFPPNFIHSLDSSHMMLTSIFCEQKGITFVSVHDCYWTHASTVHIMNQICREQFVSLHSQPILENLSKFMVQKYSSHEMERTNESSGMRGHKQGLQTVLTQVPPKGTFVLENVLDSIYFFS